MSTKDKLRRHINKMSDDEIFDMIYTDTTTGALNRRAFDMTYKEGEYVTFIDVDSLKYVNDYVGHRVGDALLKRVASSLRVMCGGVDVYRLCGDEFAIIGSEYALRVHSARFCVPGISFGGGRTLADADRAMSADKDRRQSNGLRAYRGDKPPWFGRLQSIISSVMNDHE